MSAQQEAFRSAHEAWLLERGLLKQEAFSPRPPRGGSGQSTAEESTVGYQPRSPYYEMYEQSQKEVKQLQVANNELTAENSRLKNDLRAVSHPETAISVEAAEDDLWETQGKLAETKSNLRGYATFSILSGVASAVFWWGALSSDSSLLLAVTSFFGIAFVLIFLMFGFLALDLIIKQIPAQKRVIATKQRHLDRLTLKELGLS